MPILSLRARRGAPGVMSDMKNYNALNPPDLYQYDVRQYYSYIADPTGGNPSGGIVIGGKMQQNVDRSGFFDLTSGSDPRAGIGDPAQGGNGDPLASGKDKAGNLIINPAIAYFRNPSLSVGSVNNATGTPRNKDSFILISACPDRLFGTADDLTSFGSVIP
jgi:hypothetical protein